MGCNSLLVEGGKKQRTVTCEQAGNDPDSLGSLEQTRHYKSLSPTAMLTLSHTDLQHLQYHHPSALPQTTAAFHFYKPTEMYANISTHTEETMDFTVK